MTRERAVTLYKEGRNHGLPDPGPGEWFDVEGYD